MVRDFTGTLIRINTFRQEEYEKITVAQFFFEFVFRVNRNVNWQAQMDEEKAALESEIAVRSRCFNSMLHIKMRLTLPLAACATWPYLEWRNTGPRRADAGGGQAQTGAREKNRQWLS